MSGRQNCDYLGSTSSPRHRLFSKADHLAWIQQSARIVPLFRQQLNVVATEPAAIFQVIHVRIGDKNANRSAISNHVVQSLLGCKTHHGNRARNYDSIAVFHKFDMEENLLAITLAQQAELFPTFGT